MLYFFIMLYVKDTKLDFVRKYVVWKKFNYIVYVSFILPAVVTFFQNERDSIRIQQYSSFFFIQILYIFPVFRTQIAFIAVLSDKQKFIL